MFRIEFSSRAKKEFDYNSSDKRVVEAIKLLSINPVPARRYDVKKLKGLEDTFRIRIGKIRIVYTIIWGDKVILVSRIGERESVYD